MRIIRYFGSRYTLASVTVLLCLLLASAMEGVGLSALIPVLTLVIESDSDAAETSQLGAAVSDAFAAIGVQPSLGLLIPGLIVLFWLKALVLLYAKRNVGYTVARVATDLRLELLRALLTARWSHFTQLRSGVADDGWESRGRTPRKLLLRQRVLRLGLGLGFGQQLSEAHALVVVNVLFQDSLDGLGHLDGIQLPRTIRVQKLEQLFIVIRRRVEAQVVSTAGLGQRNRCLSARLKSALHSSGVFPSTAEHLWAACASQPSGHIVNTFSVQAGQRTDLWVTSSAVRTAALRMVPVEFSIGFMACSAVSRSAYAMIG